MEISTAVDDGTLEVSLAGRLDGYWSDHLNESLAGMVRDGHHRLRVECSRLEFISSAGIAVLMKYYKQLRQLNGSLHVVNPSKAVTRSLEIAKLSGLLLEGSGITHPASGTAHPASRIAHFPSSSTRVERDGAAFDIFALDPKAKLTCRTIGRDAPLANGSFSAEDCRSLESLTPAFALGVGAFGEDFDECRSRFGELLSVSGATAYQPAGAANVADYLLVDGALTSDVQMLYGLTCDGKFSHLVRFDVQQRGTAMGLSQLLDACLTAVGAQAIGVVLIAETSGLVGAALQRSPADARPEADFFAHPGVRDRLVFTAEPAFGDGVTLAAGVVSRSAAGSAHAMLRPMGAGCVGHLHAAAFRFQPIRKGAIDLHATVSGLFEQPLRGVLHLVHDDRTTGAGESEFVRGACWAAPVEL